MQAIILAAGMGKRLKELTKNNTKCMVKVNGQTLIERLLGQLEKYDLSRIVIVTGYEGQKLVDYISTLDIRTPIEYVDNPIYDKTNNIYSLFLAKDYLLNEDSLLFESDLIFEDSVIDEIVYDKRDTLALVDHYESWMDGTCIKLSDDDEILAFIPGKAFDFHERKQYYKTVNIYKFSQHFSITHYVPFLCAYIKAIGNNEYYEQVLKVITMLDDPVIKAKRLSGQKWYEIDDIQDLDIATSIFSTDEDDKVKNLQKRYGGYWRYPKLIDYCYLVNPYFPPQKLVDEMKANFTNLLTQYPSGQNVNALLAAKNFGVHIDSIAVGNGAAELIKSLMENLDGRFGFIRPTFEEYPNRCTQDCATYYPDNRDFRYSADDIMSFFEDKGISQLVLINPDNPTGNYIPKNDLIRLIDWTDEKKINFIVDESFVDFADEENPSIIDSDIISGHKHLYIVKSISKSYGVPGLRLGIIVSSDTDMIQRIKKDVSIWNINSFAEYYMQIEGKYEKYYRKGLDRFRETRRIFMDQLDSIKGLRTVPTQANYIMVEIENGITSAQLTKNLLLKYEILIKDLSSKVGGRNYIRLAVKTEEENSFLILALKKELAEI